MRNHDGTFSTEDFVAGTLFKPFRQEPVRSRTDAPNGGAPTLIPGELMARRLLERAAGGQARSF